jgi:transcriptional regulator with XRE-family HTH domain
MTNLVRQARLSAGYTIEGAAKELKISAGYLSQIENGLRQISEERAEQIANLYGRKKEDIFLPKRYAVRKVKTA